MEELTQQTFYKAFLHIDSFKGKSSLYTWLCVIGKNEWISECRKRKTVFLQETQQDKMAAERGTGAALIFAMESDDLESSYIKKEMQITIRRALLELPRPYQDVLIMRFYGDLPFKEIAAAHGKSESWAKMTYLRGKEKIKKKLEGRI